MRVVFSWFSWIRFVCIENNQLKNVHWLWRYGHAQYIIASDKFKIFFYFNLSSWDVINECSPIIGQSRSFDRFLLLFYSISFVFFSSLHRHEDELQILEIRLRSMNLSKHRCKTLLHRKTQYVSSFSICFFFVQMVKTKCDSTASFSHKAYECALNVSICHFN